MRVCGSLVFVTLFAGCGSCSSCASRSTATKSDSTKAKPAEKVEGPLRLTVPKSQGAIELDGELEELDWRQGGRTGPFFEPGTRNPARPYSEARFLHDDENLYFGLYAADEDINVKIAAHDGPVLDDDAFSMRIQRADGGPIYHIDINANGVIRDAADEEKSWESGVQLGVDKDGTINNKTDDDEEWVIEAKLPLKSIGLSPTPGAQLLISLWRCDTPKDGKKRCGNWGGMADEKPSATIVLQ
jgi:hypothetical protein